MATYTSIESYRKSLRTRRKNFLKMANDVASRASYYMSNRAKENAPRDTGKLTSSIRRRKRKNGEWTVIGGYTDRGFNVGQWTNRGFTMNTNKGTKGFAGGQTLRYGDKGAKSPSGNPIQWTARVTPWWSKAVMSTAGKFKKEGIKGMRRVLRS